MKRILTFLFSALMFVSAAQVPQGLNYQAVARNISDGQPKMNTAINVEFTILQGSINGTPIYTESHTDTTNGFGLFTLTIGQGVTADTFSNIDWANGPKFLKVEIDNQLTGTTQLWSVPYSLASDKAKSVSYWEQVGSSIIYTTKKTGIGIIPGNSTQFQIKGDAVGMPFSQGNILNIGSNNSAGSLVVGKLDSVGNSFIQSAKTSGPSKIVLNPEGGGVELKGLPEGSPFTNGNILEISRYNSTGALVFGRLSQGNWYIQSASGGGTGTLVLNPEGGNVSVPVLEVTGADIIENTNSTQTLLSGEVVVIDPSQPNYVHRCTKKYDHLAIGVVSGAGGISHGMVLSQEGVLDGNVSFAIAGRVKVKIVGDVKPGDLLTTSNVPGHAMVAKNKRKRDGAIIGKALAIPDEHGLVLMLVIAR